MFKFCLAGEYPQDVNRIGGGVAYIVHVLAQTFAERDDIDFHIISPVKRIKGISVEKRDRATIHFVGIPKTKLIPNLLTTGHRISAVFRDVRPDAVNSHHTTTTDASVRSGIKVLHTVHGIVHNEIAYASGYEKLALMLHSKMQFKSVASADVVSSVAQYGLDAYKQWIKNQAVVIPVPIEDVFFDVPTFDNQRNILYAGGIGPRKTLFALVQAMKGIVSKYPDVVL